MNGGTGASERVAIVGAGLMGAQIGCEYALAGCAVQWIVRDRARAEQRVEQALALALAHGLADNAAVSRARASMSWGELEADDDEQPGLIVESLPEELALKAEVLGPLAAGLRAEREAGGKRSRCRVPPSGFPVGYID
jgi:3-hydroxyacyl-CoA dehydrogenase